MHENIGHYSGLLRGCSIALEAYEAASFLTDLGTKRIKVMFNYL
jgi:hypothetical protein